MRVYDKSPAFGDVTATGDTAADLARRATESADEHTTSLSLRSRQPRDRLGRPRSRSEPDEMAHGEHPDAATTLKQAFKHAVALFDTERFFEAHEFFAHIWRFEPIDRGDADFWKGVTQVAVGCCHAQRGNATGASKALQHATTYLAASPPRHHGIDVTELTVAASHIADQTHRHGAPPPIDFPAFPLAAS